MHAFLRLGKAIDAKYLNEKRPKDWIARAYQARLVGDVVSFLKENRVCAIDVWCGGGKTGISAMVAKEILTLASGKKILFVSTCNKMSQFKEIFRQVMGNIRISNRFELDADV